MNDNNLEKLMLEHKFTKREIDAMKKKKIQETMPKKPLIDSILDDISK
jgi:hypothetical protein